MAGAKTLSERGFPGSSAVFGAIVGRLVEAHLTGAEAWISDMTNDISTALRTLRLFPEDAGALVDGGTQQRGEAEGLSLSQCLGRADAGSFLEASGDLVHTGPTGTNVMDLVLAWKAD